MGKRDQEHRPRRIGLNTSMTNDGRTLTLREWAQESGHSPSRIIQRLVAGWSDEDAITRPCRVAATKPSSGERFELWTVIDNTRGRYAVWCRCRCGKHKMVNTSDLRLGKSRGCRQCTVSGKRSPTYRHGRTGTSLHKVWMGMIARCEIKSATGYKDYGGRGISVCDGWRGCGGFEAFLADMGERPTALHSIERINNDGDYTPDNCRWATRREQDRNTRRSRLIVYNGESKTLREWSDEIEINYETLRQRIGRGWSIERALGKIGSKDE